MIVLWERVEKAVTDDDDDNNNNDNNTGKRHLLSSQPSTMVAAKKNLDNTSVEPNSQYNYLIQTTFNSNHF